MLLDKMEIKEENFLFFTEESSYRDASYDLTIGNIYDLKKDEEKNRYVLKPGGMVLAFSNEVFNLPSNILGMTTVKNSLSNNGVMAVNIGLVDPNYIGPISCILINFGITDEIITKKDSFLRMTFHRLTNVEKVFIEKTSEELVEIKNEYVKNKKSVASQKLSNTFLSLDSFRNKILIKTKLTIFKEILKQIGYIAFLVTVVIYGISEYQKYSDNKELKNLKEDNKNLENLLNKLKDNLILKEDKKIENNK